MLVWRLSASLLAVALPWTAQEPHVESADPALARIRAMLEDIDAARGKGEHARAREIVREALAAWRAVPGFAERKDAHDLLLAVGRAAYHAGATQIAHDAWQRVAEYRSQTLPADHVDLQKARGNLGLAKHFLGDLAGARVLHEGVHDACSRTLPDDHADLQWARNNLASTRYALGDLPGARDLWEKVYQVRSRTLPDDHPDLHMARDNLAIAKYRLGDLASARALQERGYEFFSRTLPDDHEILERARNNLAATKRALGDLAGARVLFERSYEIRSRILPDDHVDLQATRLNLATTRYDLGDRAGACALLEKVQEIGGRTLPDNHPVVQQARSHLANTKYDLGDLDGARALRAKVYEVASRSLPDDHPDLQTARTNLASTKSALGDLAGAHALREKVWEVFSKTRPDEHPDLQGARGALGWDEALLGHVERASALAVARGRAALRRLAGWALAPREIGAMAAQESAALDLLLTLAGGFGDLEAQPGLARDALAISQLLRGVQIRTARASRRAHSADPQQLAALEGALRTAVAGVSRVAGERLEGAGEVLDGRRRARSERLARAVEAKERIERELGALAAKAGHVATMAAQPAALAGALAARSAAAAIVSFRHGAPDPEHSGRRIREERLVALVLDHAGHVAFVPLAPVADLQAAVETLRNAMQPQAARGLPPRSAHAPDAMALTAAHERLRERLIAPLLAACGPIDTLYVAVDELLELVPMDALPLDAQHLVGERVAIRPLASLLDLLEAPGAPVNEAPQLLVVGGLDYGRAAQHAATLVDPGAASPVLERAGKAGAWTLLPGTAREASEIAALFARAFPEAETEQLADEHAGKAQIASAAPRATFVHVATHGYFAPESVKSVADAPAGEGAITGLSPLVLCGLALSGANLPPDELGRHAGILTAEEILALDLSRCFLVTLSACDTSLGVRRAGQGYSSLRAALQGAGARFVLTSLWKVGDEATTELMVDFYRRLWVEKKEPHAALWEAKMAARSKGAPFRDWAGWVLTGR